MSEKEVRTYLEFMSNADNVMKCGSCPENRGDHSDIERRLPCGQQNCWVSCHIRQK